MNSSTAIIVIVLILIGIFALKSYIKRLSVGCCGGGDDAVKRTFSRPRSMEEYKYRASMEIEGMTCKNCAIRVENELCKIDGVYARVNLKRNMADIQMKSEIGEDELKRAVLRAGYTPVGLVRLN